MSWARVVGYPGLLLICVSSIPGQSPSQPAPTRSSAGHLILQPPTLDDEEGHHRTNTLYPAGIKVAVKDAEDRPIPGAAVEVTLPEKGAGAILQHAGAACSGDGERIAPTPSDKVACLKTDGDGIAQIEGLRANKVAGDFSIRVRASFGGETTEFANIKERNELPPFLVRNKRKLWIIGAASAAVAITVVLLRPSPQPTATIGSVTGTGPVHAPAGAP